MAGVMAVVYLVFTQGYAPAVGDRLLREELCTRAIGLAETLLLVAPADPEVRGLLALMLIQHARRDARVGEDGQLTLLAAQDRGLWHGGEIARGLSLLSDISPETAGPYQLQALIAAEHVNKLSAEMTNWKRIAALYERLEAIQPSPFVTLNRAVAVFEAEGPEAGLAVLESIGDGLDHHPGLHLARGEMLLRAGERTGARAGFIRALALSQNAVERAFLETRIGLRVKPCRWGAFCRLDRERDIDKAGFGDLDAVGQPVAAGIGFHADGDRSGADALDGCVDAEYIAHLDRCDEGHGFDRNGGDAAQRAFDSGNRTGNIHLAHHPAAKDITGRIGIGGHGGVRMVSVPRGSGFSGGCIPSILERPVAGGFFQWRRQSRNVDILADGNLVAIGEDPAIAAMADDHSGLGPAMANGADFAQYVGHGEQFR